LDYCYVLSLLRLVFLLKTQKKKNYAYCELVGTQKFMNPNKLTVQIDFGQEQNFWNTKDSRIRDEKGEVRVFNSMVGVMNFMGVLGWEFAQAYVVTYQNQNVYHWLLKKEVSDADIEELKKMVERQK
jgi:hypothetical protein